MSVFNKLTIRTSNPALDLLKPHISHPYQLFHSPGDVEDTHPVQELSSGIPSKMESVLIINDIDDMNASFALSEEGKCFGEDNKFQALSISFYGNKRMKTYADTSFTNQSSSTGFTSTRNVKAHIRQNENSAKTERMAKMPINKLMKASTVVNSPLIQAINTKLPSSKGMESSRIQRKDIKGTVIDLNLKTVPRQEKSTSQTRKGEKPEMKPQESMWRNREFGIVREGNSTSRTALKSNRNILSPRQELKKSASGLINGLRSSQVQGRSGREANIPLGIIDLKGNCIREASQGKSRPGSSLVTNRAGKRDLSAELTSVSRAVTLYQKILESHQGYQGDSMNNIGEKKPEKCEENLTVSAVVVKNQDVTIKLSSYRAQPNVQMSERRKHLEENIKKKVQEKSIRDVSSPQKTRHTAAKSVEKYLQKPVVAQNSKAQKKSVGNAQSLVKRPAGGKEPRLSTSSSSYTLFETEPNLRSSKLKKDPSNIDLSVSSPYMKSLKQSLVVESNKSKTNNNKGMRLLGEHEKESGKNSMLKLKKYLEGDEQDIGEILRSQRLDQV